MKTMIETVETQSVIIKMQSDVIDRLFKLLMEHISVEEADKLSIAEELDRITLLKGG